MPSQTSTGTVRTSNLRAAILADGESIRVLPFLMVIHKEAMRHLLRETNFGQQGGQQVTLKTGVANSHSSAAATQKVPLSVGFFGAISSLYTSRYRFVVEAG